MNATFAEPRGDEDPEAAEAGTGAGAGGAVNVECFETLDGLKEQLEDVERALAQQLPLGRHVFVRRELLRLARTGKLVENELVAQWHELYANYVDWARASGRAVGHPRWSSPGARLGAVVGSEQETTDEETW